MLNKIISTALLFFLAISGVYADNLFITNFVVDSNGNETLVNTVNVQTKLNTLTTLLLISKEIRNGLITNIFAKYV